jgi:hypothetical protein
MTLLLEQAKEFVIATLPNVKFMEDGKNVNLFSYHDDGSNYIGRGSIKVTKQWGAHRFTINIMLHSNYSERSSNERMVRKFADTLNDKLNYTKNQTTRLLGIAKQIKRDDDEQRAVREQQIELESNKEKFIKELRTNGFEMSYSTDYHRDLNATMMTEVIRGGIAKITLHSKDVDFITKLRDFVRDELGEKV